MGVAPVGMAVLSKRPMWGAVTNDNHGVSYSALEEPMTPHDVRNDDYGAIKDAPATASADVRAAAEGACSYDCRCIPAI